MIVSVLYRSFHQKMYIHQLPSGRYAFQVENCGFSDNHNWTELFYSLDDAISFAELYGWVEDNF